jgi:hypothetical protein
MAERDTRAQGLGLLLGLTGVTAAACLVSLTPLNGWGVLRCPAIALFFVVHVTAALRVIRTRSTAALPRQVVPVWPPAVTAATSLLATLGVATGHRTESLALLGVVFSGLAVFQAHLMVRLPAAVPEWAHRPPRSRLLVQLFEVYAWTIRSPLVWGLSVMAGLYGAALLVAMVLSFVLNWLVVEAVGPATFAVFRAPYVFFRRVVGVPKSVRASLVLGVAWAGVCMLPPALATLSSYLVVR